MEDYKNSLESNRASRAIKDSIYNRSSANSLAYYQTLYEIEKQEKELVEKSTSISLLEKDNENFKKALLFGGITIIFGFGLILLYRNHRHLKTHKILQEKFSQELLISQEGERRRISKDLHDGLGQQLLVIKNKLMIRGDAETKNMVDHAIEEVRAISRDLHPFHLQELGITKAIKYTLNLIDENTALFISSEIDNIDNIFSKEDEMNIYRIVQESLSNILKHANADAGRVSVKKFNNNILISIRDNGIGFDFAEKYQDVKSLGLKTLLERTKFLKGQMKVTSKKETGTILEFQFPL
jgi:signal transduction histidine kinase